MTEAHFLDTSALIKRYIDEPGTEAMRDRCFCSAPVEILVSALTYAEIYATLARLVKTGALTVADYESIVTSFEEDWKSFVTVEFNYQVRRHVSSLARKHSLRGADLVQLASAVQMRARRSVDLFVACDVRLANAAVDAGLPLFNPEVTERR